MLRGCYHSSWVISEATGSRVRAMVFLSYSAGIFDDHSDTTSGIFAVTIYTPVWREPGMRFLSMATER